MSQIVDTVPSAEQVEAYAAWSYRAFASYQLVTNNVGEPRWEYLRHDLKSIWIGQARVTLSVYAYGHIPVEDDDA